MRYHNTKPKHKTCSLISYSLWREYTGKLSIQNSALYGTTTVLSELPVVCIRKFMRGGVADADGYSTGA
jgi:hypothetical protein